MRCGRDPPRRTGNRLAGVTDSMTDHNSPAGAVGGGQPSGQPGPFSLSQQPPQQAWQGQQAPAPQQPQPGAPRSPQPQQLPSDAARAQVAAAWVRNTPRAGQAAVPSLPPRETRPQGESKKEKRERGSGPRARQPTNKKRPRRSDASTTALRRPQLPPHTPPLPLRPAGAPCPGASSPLRPAPRRSRCVGRAPSPRPPRRPSAVPRSPRPLPDPSVTSTCPSRAAGFSGGGRRTHVALPRHPPDHDLPVRARLVRRDGTGGRQVVRPARRRAATQPTSTGTGSPSSRPSRRRPSPSSTPAVHDVLAGERVHPSRRASPATPPPASTPSAAGAARAPPRPSPPGTGPPEASRVR